MRSGSFHGISQSRQTESLARYSEVKDATIPLSSGLSLRIHHDSQPRVGKVADLQKGLILLYKNVELVGEGLGFGVPIIKNMNETYFSGSARLRLAKDGGAFLVRKEFILDLIERNEFASVRLENRRVRAVLRFVGDVYQKHKRLQHLTPKTLAHKAGYKAKFVKVDSIGSVLVDYTIDGTNVHVRADFGSVLMNRLEGFFMLNEQAGTCFRRYSDSDGLELFDNDIGAWFPIKADSACLTHNQGTVGFRVHTVDGALLRRGGEYLKDSLDWVGLDYELKQKKRLFEYDVEVVGA
jgi:hypothetical protein